MEKNYIKMIECNLTDKQVIKFFSNLVVTTTIKDFEYDSDQKFMAIVLDKYPHLFDNVFDIISKNKNLLAILMDEGDGVHHVFYSMIMTFDFDDIPLVLDMIDKYWTRNGVRMYHLIYSVTEYEEISCLMDWYYNKNKFDELRKELHKRKATSKEFDLKQFKQYQNIS